MKKHLVFKILVFLPLMSISMQLLAQDFYITAGLNFSKLRQVKDADFEPDRSLRPGFQIGASIDIQMNELLSFMPGLQLSLKREHLNSSIFIPFEIIGGSGDVFELTSESLVNEIYIDVPLPLKLKYNFGDNEVYGLFGPYISYRIFEKTSSKTNSDNYFLPPSPDKVKMENLDYGLLFGLGVTRNRYLIQVSFDHGFYRNIEYQYDEIIYTQNSKNSSLKVNFGYRL